MKAITRFRCASRPCTRELAILGDPIGMHAIGWWMKPAPEAFGPDERPLAYCPEHRLDELDEEIEREAELLQGAAKNVLRLLRDMRTRAAAGLEGVE